MAAGMPAGRELGVALDTLLDAVIDEKVKNEKEALLRYLFSNEPIRFQRATALRRTLLSSIIAKAYAPTGATDHALSCCFPRFI